MLKIATWNVNSLRVRLPQVLQWLAETKPDVIALQETKVPDEDFPLMEIKAAGYECLFNGQKTYNGVAILSRIMAVDAILDLPDMIDPQRRMLAATIADVRILNLYVPNGESIESVKYEYKLKWLNYLRNYIADQLQKYPKVIMLGDFNIAPHEHDVHDPQLWTGKVLFSDKERQVFHSMIEMGFKDCFRLHDQPEKSYSWWDYRLNSFKRNLGLRIDHILASQTLAQNCRRCYIDKMPRSWERPSDHAPVVAEFE